MELCGVFGHEFGRMDALDETEVYTFSVRSYKFTKQCRYVSCYRGKHLAGKTNDNVQSISFCEKINVLPRGLHRIFPNLKHININKSSIQSISRLDFKGLVKLETFHVCLTQLTTLPDDLFEGLPKLKSVRIDNNKITFATPKLLKPFVGREEVEVTFIKNPGISAFFSKKYAGSLGSLEELMKEMEEKLKKPDESHRSLLTVGPSRSLSSGIKELWTSGRLSDCTIVAASKKEFKVHKVILALSSEVFGKLFESDGLKIVQISGFSDFAVEALLTFIYTDEVYEGGDPKENFAIAAKFKIKELMNIYEYELIHQLDNSNADEYLEFANTHDAVLLRTEANRLVEETRKHEELMKKLSAFVIRSAPKEIKEIM